MSKIPTPKLTLLAGIAFLVGACSDQPHPTDVDVSPQFSHASGPNLWTGSGHFYELVTNQARWNDAKTAAEGKTHLGISGHLATLTSAGENDFVNANFAHVGVFWLGGRQPGNAGEPADGWFWV